MKERFDNKLITSLVLWLDNRICNDGQGYINTSSLLYRENDSARPFIAYNSPYKGWVYDACVQGAMIPQGFYSNSGDFLNVNSGIVIDYNNGRVLSNNDFGPTISGNYARKEYNVYFSNEEETQFYLEQITNTNPNVAYSPTGSPPYRFVAPCVIVTDSESENVPYALGGADLSTKTFKLYCISNNNFNQEALNSLLVDSARTYIPVINSADTPFIFYGDLKVVGFNYCDLQYKYPCYSGAYIKSVHSYKLGQTTNKVSNFFLSVFDFDMETVRFPKID